MAKLIKRDPDADTPGIHEQQTQISGEMPQRRAAIIDKGTFEAKHEALSIRDRAEAQASEILAEANARAEQVLAEARQQAEQLQQEAHAEGLRAGQEQGAADYVALCAQLGLEVERSQADLAPHIAELALLVARRVLCRELEFAPERVVDIVKKTLADKVRQRREVTLRVHPSDAVHLREHKAELLEILSRCQEIRVQEDEAVPPHGAIIETEAGVVDVQLETQLRALERALQAVA